MSISGLYDSPRGDALARKSMLCFKKPEPDKHDRFCACGGMLPHIPKWRDGKAVCDGCAEIISRKKREARAEVKRTYVNVCVTCGKDFPMSKITIRNGKKYCKEHAANERTTFAHTYRCEECGVFMPFRSLVRRESRLFCPSCGSKREKGIYKAKARTFCCSKCGSFAPRELMRQKHKKLFCSKCFDAI